MLFICSSLSALIAQEKGNATYYNSNLTGHHTTDGSRYHPDSLTCAHKSYPLGTYLLVKNPKNNQQVIVKVTDRGPFTKRMMIDLSYSAAKTLDIIREGIAMVEISKFDFLPAINLPLPEALSLIPAPKTYLNLNIKQMYFAKNMFNKFFGENQKK